MNSKEVEVEGKKFIVNELKYKDISKLAGLSNEEAAEKILRLSVDISDEDYDNLTIKEGIHIQKAIKDINGIEDFQIPLTK